jgi:disintegrin and metalloproteinase domain-containing protein 10
LSFHLSVFPPLPGHAKGCGITDEVLEWMEGIQNGAVDPEEGLLPQLKHPKSKPYQRQGPTAQELRDDLDLLHLHSSHDHPSSKYKPPANTPTTSSSGGDPETRKTDRSRRALPPSFNSKTTCTLSIQTDPLLWKHISEQVEEELTLSLISLSPSHHILSFPLG